MNKFKKGDKVKVITGKDRGKISQITKLFPKLDKILLHGVNVVKKHMKPNKSNPEGGIIRKELPIHFSNVMHIDPATNVVSKIGFRFLPNGRKTRYFKKSNNLYR